MAQLEIGHFQGINPDNIRALNPSKVSSFTEKDSKLEFGIFLLKSSDLKPVMYQSNLISPVCDDTLCRIIECTIYWDLTGKYLGFTNLAKMPFTKFDHIEFTEQDYSKLHVLMMENNSVLNRKEKAELIDQKLKRESKKYDAVTGVTALEIKNTVVDGALYTSYTLWHIANGEAKHAISKHTQEIIDEELFQILLKSEKPNYQSFALKLFDYQDFITFRNIWIDILKNGIPLNRQYLLKKLPAKVWQDKTIQMDLAQLIPHLDTSSKTLLLEGFKKIKHPSKKALKELKKQRGELSRNQNILLNSFMP